MDTGNHLQEESKELNCQQRRLERIKVYINEKLCCDLIAAVVSKKFGISISTLHHSFKKDLLQIYQQYVEKERMNKAMEMIRQGKGIQQDLFGNGYKSRFTFYNPFKRTFQHSPATFKYDRGKGA